MVEVDAAIPLDEACELAEPCLKPARDQFETRGNLDAFALVGTGTGSLTLTGGDGPTRSAVLDDLYAQVRSAAAENGAETAVVVSEGSSDAHANLLVVFVEHRHLGAARGIARITYRRKPLFIGAWNIRRGQVSLSPLEWQPIARRVWTPDS